MTSNFTAFPDDSAFLDAHPLCPLEDDGEGEDLNEFDLFLDDEFDERFLAGSLSQTMDPVLSASIRSRSEPTPAEPDDMDFEVLRKSLELMLNMTEVKEEQSSNVVPETPPQSNKLRRTRSVTSRARPKKSFEVQRYYSLQPQTTNAFSNLDRTPFDNNDDVSMCSFNTAQTSQTTQSTQNFQSSEPACFSSSPGTQAEYTERLEKLAQSMKRTEESRRQVLIQREQLKIAERQRKAAEEEALARASMTYGPSPLTPEKSTIVDAFFSGSRNTLTNGLEQSRRQLRMYMNQINSQQL